MKKSFNNLLRSVKNAMMMGEVGDMFSPVEIPDSATSKQALDAAMKIVIDAEVEARAYVRKLISSLDDLRKSHYTIVEYNRSPLAMEMLTLHDDGRPFEQRLLIGSIQAAYKKCFSLNEIVSNPAFWYSLENSLRVEDGEDALGIDEMLYVQGGVYSIGDLNEWFWESMSDLQPDNGDDAEEYDEYDDPVLYGDWLKGSDGLFDPDPNGEWGFSAVVGESAVQVVRSKYWALGPQCSPCYPMQVDLNSGSTAAYKLQKVSHERLSVGYALPAELLWNEND